MVSSVNFKLALRNVKVVSLIGDYNCSWHKIVNVVAICEMFEYQLDSVITKFVEDCVCVCNVLLGLPIIK